MKQNKPFFSIIIPLYEAYKDYYSELIQSITMQTYNNYECVLVYNKRWDSLNKIVNSKFIYLSSDSDSVSIKRNIGIENSSGKYIVFCDADDFLSPIFLEIMFNSLNSSDFIVSDITRNEKNLKTAKKNHIKATRIANKNEIHDYVYGRYLNKPIYPDCNYIFGSVWGKCFSREIILKYKILFIDPPPRAEDMLFVNEYVKHIDSMVLVEAKLYFWRKNPNSTMTNIKTSFYDLEYFIEAFSQNISNIEDKYKTNINNYICKIIISFVHKLFRCYFNKYISKNYLKSKLLFVTNVSSKSFYVLSNCDANIYHGYKKIYLKNLIRRKFMSLLIMERVHNLLKHSSL